MQPRLSALTPPVVDQLYNIDGAEPVDAPMFLFLVGAPGAGKSTGHEHAIRAGLLPANGNYATLNMDTLLESLTPYRAATAIAHSLHKKPGPAYGSTKENLGAFKWYDDNGFADPDFNKIRRRFLPLKNVTTEYSIIDRNHLAIKRAIDKHINIVYETTLSLSRSGRVNKVDEIIQYLEKEKAGYKIVFYHVTGSASNIARRIHARQELSNNLMPFYRYVPTDVGLIEKLITDTATAFNALRKQYKNVAEFVETANPDDPSRAASRSKTRSNRRRAIMRAYGSPQSELFKLSDQSLYVSSPQSDRFKLSPQSLYVSSPSNHRSETRRRRRI